MLEWADRIGCSTHVLLTKSDKLSRKDGAATLTNVRRQLRDEASVQLFSATKDRGVDKARVRLEEFLHSDRRRTS